MFGLRKKKPASEETQIPYQVYESVYEPTNRRRRLLMRLLLALAIVTILVLGLLAARRIFGGNGSSGGEPAGSPDSQVQQAPQNNPSLPGGAGEPARLPISGNSNNGTVEQPQ
jgi:hypothetical protein